jgi:acyl carrier protein
MMSSPLFRSLCEVCTAENFPALRLLRLRSEAVYRSDFELYKKHLPRRCILAVGLASSETGFFRNGFFDHDSQIFGNEIPVGYAVADKEVWLQDSDGKRLGSNEIGEIVVRSKYLSPGYWRRPDLTEGKFESDPEGGEKRICLTGDLGMMLPDGCLVHKGRKDFRIKVRGYRVELAEVEKALLSHPGVSEAVVVAATNEAGENRLAAYFTPKKEQPPAVNELRCFLKEKLPSFMSPSVIVALESLPLTRNGKVDRNALPTAGSSRPDLSTAFIAPTNPTEERLAAIWADVLGLDCVGVDDNFFELGGHSLSAARIISRVIKTFQLELSIEALFQTPTVRDMAAVIRQNETSIATQDDMSQLLKELEKLSEAEAERVLGTEPEGKH